MEKKSYYAIIPADVRYDERLKLLSRMLYGELTALCNEKGFCWATNRYFADLYKSSIQTISSCISQLKEFGYIEVDFQYKENSKEVDKRIIKIISDPMDKILKGSSKNFEGGIQKNLKDNITFNNTINISKKFTPPTLEEVKEYCKERNNTVDAETFVDFYQSKGWLVGKNQMKDWKAAVRTWERNRQNKVTPITPSKPQSIRHEPTEEELLEFRRKRQQEIAEWNERNRGR